jgi:hypothetical protein
MKRERMSLVVVGDHRIDIMSDDTCRVYFNPVNSGERFIKSFSSMAEAVSNIKEHK